MGDVKEYIRGDKHVHQAGSVMIKIVQYNVPGQRQEGCCQQADEDAEAQERKDAEEQERKDAEELEREFADYEEVDDAAGADAAPSAMTDPELPPASRFVNRVKAIVMEAATKNGQKIVTNTRAWRGEYVFFVDGERIGRMMDDLMKNHEEKIVEFLRPYQKCDGVTVVAPFIGKLLDMEELRARDLQKSDLDFAFAPYYNNGASAVKRMSDKLDSEAARMLIGTLQGLLRRYPRA